jgi:HD superfamily phosphodiesterase
VDRVRRMALKLAPTLEEKPDMLVLELIALFHDMADGKLPSWPTVPD